MLSLKGLYKWNSQKIGIVLSGGGAKGAYEAGILKALDDYDLSDKVYAISGTSIGALNLLFYTSGGSSRLTELWNNISFNDVVPLKDSEKITDIKDVYNKISDIKDILVSQFTREETDVIEGFFTQEAVYDLINKEIDFKKVRNHSARLFSCAYNISKHKPVFFELKNESDEMIKKCILASACIPHVYDPVEINDDLYIDGGINDSGYGIKNSVNTPVKPLIECNVDTIFVVHLKPREKETGKRYSDNRIIDIYPSKPLEPVRGAGTLMFTESSINQKISLGYEDGQKIFSEYMVKMLKL